MSPVRGFLGTLAALMPLCLVALSGCGDTNVDGTYMDGGIGDMSSGGSVNGGASNGGASNGGASNGGASNGGTANGGASNGGVSSGGAAAGGRSGGSGGSATAGGAGKAGGGTSSAGGSAGGSNGSDGGGPDATAPACPASTCSNPTHTILMDPNDPQAGITLSGFYVDTDTWNAANYQVTQTMYVCDYGNWYVTANMNDDKHDGAVKTYPNVHKDFNSAPKISSFTSITSCFAHTAPHVGIYEYAYDIWLNGVASSGSTEVMIWTDNFGQTPSGGSVETVTFDGASYDVHRSGSYIAFVAKKNVTSGTVNLLSFFQHVISKGWIPDTSTIGAIDYGVELVSTNGMDARFEVNAFTLNAN